MRPANTRRVSLRLPPTLDHSLLHDQETAAACQLIPWVTARLSKLCPIDNLELGGVIGRGGTSCVRWCLRVDTEDVYAAKVFNTSLPERSRLLSAELRALRAIDSPCVIGFHGAWSKENYVYLLLDAMHLGSLFDMMYVSGRYFCSAPGARGRDIRSQADGHRQRDSNEEETAMLAISFQLLWGLRDIHAVGLVHQDVKPSNVLVSTCGSVKLADFGTSRFETETANSIAGTFRYMPPEGMSQAIPGPEADVWGAGMVIAELVTHRVPFSSCDTHVELVQLVTESDNDTIVRQLLRASHGAPESITGLVRAILNIDPKMRPPAADMLLSLAFTERGLETPKDAQEIVCRWLCYWENEDKTKSTFRRNSTGNAGDTSSGSLSSELGEIDECFGPNDPPRTEPSRGRTSSRDGEKSARDVMLRIARRKWQMENDAGISRSPPLERTSYYEWPLMKPTHRKRGLSSPSATTVSTEPLSRGVSPSYSPPPPSPRASDECSSWWLTNTPAEAEKTGKLLTRSPVKAPLPPPLPGRTCSEHKTKPETPKLSIILDPLAPPERGRSNAKRGDGNSTRDSLSRTAGGGWTGERW